MADVFKAPEKYDHVKKSFKVFLAGAIDQGKAVNWQDKITEKLSDMDDLVILNPRRDDWDSSWGVGLDDSRFAEQVAWEYDALEASDVIVLVLTKDSKAPISLLELGMFASSGKICVVCEKGFYRYGNVDFVCKKYKIDMYGSIDDAVKFVRNRFAKSPKVGESLDRIKRLEKK